MNPLLFLKTVNCHIIKFFCDFMDSGENYHVMVVNTCRMPTPRKHRILRFRMLLPFSTFKFKAPKIFEFFIVFVFSSENIHFTLVNTSRMSSTWKWCFLSLFTFYFHPFIRLKIKHNHCIPSDSFFKACKNIHLFVVHYCCMFIS